MVSVCQVRYGHGIPISMGIEIFDSMGAFGMRELTLRELFFRAELSPVRSVELTPKAHRNDLIRRQQ